jgi:hypothetical protein
VHHRQVGELLVEVFGGVSAFGHGGRDQLVGLPDRAGRRVDELLLEGDPVRDVALAGFGGEGFDVEGGDSLLAVSEFLFGLATGVAFVHGAVVFGAEAVAELSPALLLLQDDEADGQDHDHRHGDGHDCRHYGHVCLREVASSGRFLTGRMEGISDREACRGETRQVFAASSGLTSPLHLVV